MNEGDEKQMLIWLAEAVGIQYVMTPDFCSYNAFLMTTTLCNRYLDANKIEDATIWFNMMSESIGLPDYMDAEEKICWNRLSSRIKPHL